MSVADYFTQTAGLTVSLYVPHGTKATLLACVTAVETRLQLRRVRMAGRVRWRQDGRFGQVDDECLCEIAEAHNAWVRQCFEDFSGWAKEPVPDGEVITPHDAESFWHGLDFLVVPQDRWTMRYYRNRMAAIYEAMRGRPSEGYSFEPRPLTREQAGAVIELFEGFLDPTDAQLTVPDGHDTVLARDHYRWCAACERAFVLSEAVACRRGRGCGLFTGSAENA